MNRLSESIVKLLAKLVFAPWSGAIDEGFELLTLARERTQDQSLAAQTERAVCEIAEAVAGDMVALVEMEAEMPADERAAMLSVVEETIVAGRVDATTLAGLRLAPEGLAAMLLESRSPSWDQLSDAGQELHDGIVRETAARISGLAGELPGFQEQVARQSLEDHAEAARYLQRILSSLARISGQLSSGRDPADFASRYRQRVVSALDRMQLFGVSNLTRASREHSLSVAYITLHLALGASSVGADEEKLLSPQELLAGRKRILVRGPAGSGKTTLEKWIAVQAANGELGESVDTWQDVVPFFVELRRFADTPFPGPEDFVRLVAETISAEQPQDWVRNILRSGEGVILVDGVDEVGETRRRAVREWIGDLLGTFPDARMVVTSREAAVEEGWLDPEGFLTFDLHPLRPEDADLLIDQWHDAVAHEGIGEDERAALPALRESLKKAIRDSPPLRNLAENPLMCAMLCALNRDRRQQLPKERIELYDACCEMLLERRDTDREVPRDPRCPFLSLSVTKKRQVLKHLAWYMVLDKKGLEISREETDNHLRACLPPIIGGDDDVDVSEFRRRMVVRSGVLRAEGPDRIQFVHRTFQDYFAALAAVDQNHVEYVCNHAEDERWREIAILSAGLGNAQQTKLVIERLCERADQEPQWRHALYLVALSCLETARELDTELRSRITGKVGEIVPPGTMAEANALAAAGTVAVPHLRRNSDWNVRGAAAAVRALANIGGDAAAAAILEWAEDHRAGVRREVVRWCERTGDLSVLSCLVAGTSQSSWGPSLRVRGDVPFLSLDYGTEIACPFEWRALPPAVADHLVGMVLLSVGDITREDLGLLPRNLQWLELVDLPELDGEDLDRIPRGLKGLALAHVPWVKGVALGLLPQELEALALIDLPGLDGEDLHRIPRDLKVLSLGGLPGVDGKHLQHLPRGLVHLALSEMPGVRGPDLSLLPAELDGLALVRLPKVSGSDLRALPQGLRELALVELDVAGADLSLLPPSLERVSLVGLDGVAPEHLSLLPGNLGGELIPTRPRMRTDAVRFLPRDDRTMLHRRWWVREGHWWCSYPESYGPTGWWAWF